MSDLISHEIRSDLSIFAVGRGSDELCADLGISNSALEVADCAIFLVSSLDGIVRADSNMWAVAREMYIPSIVLITDLSAENETDFEDMTAIAGRILDPVVTPYLVLHLDDGSPIALIDLNTLEIRDYSSGQLEVRPSEHGHQEVIAEFRDEYLESVEAAGEGAFENALLYPALPWVRNSNGEDIGIVELVEYLNQIPISS